MSTPNIILIKRRLANSPLGTSPMPLTGGELGFNEVNSTLYYGSSNGVLEIAGSGSYTKLSLTNTISSDLQSQIKNLLNSSEFDTKINAVSSKLTTNINNISSYIINDFKPYVDSNFLNLTGGIIDGNLTVTGNISSTGNSYFLNTIYSTTSAISVVNVGNGPALYVGNNGLGDIASFFDLDQNVEVLHVGGSNGSFPNVGVKTSTPNVDFTVNGHISASKNVHSNNLYVNETIKTNALEISNNKIFTDINNNLVLNVTLSGNSLNKISNFIIDCGQI